MTQGIETIAADEFIYQTLSGDPTLLNLLSAAYASHAAANEPGIVPTANVPEIYGDTVPNDVTFPYVAFQMHNPAGDVEVENNAIVYSVMDYLVRVVDRSQTFQVIAPIYARAHTLLHKATGTVADGVVYNMYRIRPYKMTELDDLVAYKHLGGIYRMFVQG